MPHSTSNSKHPIAMYTHIHLVYAGLATVFVLVLAYMFLYKPKK